MTTKAILLMAAAVGACGLGAAAYLFSGADVVARDLSGLEGDPNRGAYIIRLAGCVACHTDTKNGGAFLAGGAPIKTPFGAFRAPNITPQPQSGIGQWTLRQFSDALTAGRGPEGWPYFPVFPYTSYTRMHDQDIVDLWAFLRTVPPVDNRAPDSDIRFPFGFRPLIFAWQTLFFEPGPFRPIPHRSKLWNRGAYVVTGPGHCVECHTPRNALGGLDRNRLLSGASAGPDGEKAPAITRDSKSFAKWSSGDLFFALRFGLKPDGDSFSGSMGEVVRDGTAYLSDADLQAITDYLFSPEQSNP